MRTQLIRGVMALAAVIALSAPAAAQSIVRGKVTDAGGKPVEGATVTFTQASGRQLEVKTDRNGDYLQVGLASGPYSVVAAKDNLKQTKQMNVSQRGTVNLSFQLTPVSGLSAEEIKTNAAMQVLAQSALDAMQAGRDDEAIQKFTELATKIPSCVDCHYNIGVLNMKKQQFDQAEASFKKAIELNPNHGDSYTGLANLYNTQKKFDLAQQASAKAAELSSVIGGSGNAEAQYNQGVVLWNAGKFAEAKVLFEAAIKADPAMAMAHYQLGMANLNLGQIPAARASFEEYLKVDPNGPKAAEVKAFVAQLPQ